MAKATPQKAASRGAANTTLPSNLDAERAVLGSILMDRDAIIAVADRLSSDMFYLPNHRRIYDAMLACYDTRTPPDLQTVNQALIATGYDKEIGGIEFLVELSNSVPTSYHVEYYAKIVMTTAKRRRGIQAGGTIAALYYDLDRDIDDIDAEAQTLLMEAQDEADDEGMLSADELMTRIHMKMGLGETPAVPTGCYDLDRLLAGGLHQQDLILVAARPAVGKSSLGLFWMKCATEAGYRVHYCSLEMGGDSLGHRLLATETGINIQTFRRNRFSDDENKVIFSAMNDFARLPFTVDEKMAVTLAEMRRRVLRRAARIGKPDLLIIDYLQLLGSRSGKDNDSASENRQVEVAAISRGLKSLARELEIPVVAMSQLSRNVEHREDKTPRLSDLRESGALEQDADIVMFIARPNAPETNAEKIQRQMSNTPELVEIHIAKHRNGPIGVVPMWLLDHTGRWSNADVTGYAA